CEILEVLEVLGGGGGADARRRWTGGGPAVGPVVGQCEIPECEIPEVLEAVVELTPDEGGPVWDPVVGQCVIPEVLEAVVELTPESGPVAEPGGGTRCWGLWDSPWWGPWWSPSRPPSPGARGFSPAKGVRDSTVSLGHFCGTTPPATVADVLDNWVSAWHVELDEVARSGGLLDSGQWGEAAGCLMHGGVLAPEGYQVPRGVLKAALIGGWGGY
ncbi:hypothetical protein CYMTET_11268, partial [Cymbomonas tetramitiformis]